MSKASEQWTRDCKFKALGLTPPANTTELLPYADGYIKQFLVPATWMTSGKDKSEFNFTKAYKGDQAALSYLSSQVVPATINKLISVMNGIAPSPTWMIYFPKLMDYYKYDGLLNSSIKKANTEFLKEHKMTFGVCYADGTDITVVLNKNGTPIDGYPENIYVYTEEEISMLGVRDGSTTIANLLKKKWWTYNNVEATLLQKIKFLKPEDFQAYEAPIIHDDGAIVVENVSYLSEKRPPIEIMSIYESLPPTIVEHHGTKIHALVDLVNSGDLVLEDTASKAYVIEVKKILAEGRTAMAFEDDGSGIREKLEEDGYVTSAFDEAIRQYLVDFELDENITVKDLLKFVTTDDDEYVPEPFDKEAFRKEVLDSVNWQQISTDAKDSVDRVQIVAEALSSIGVKKEIIDKIKLCLTSSTKLEDSELNDNSSLHTVLEAVGFTHQQIGEIFTAYESKEQVNLSGVLAYYMRTRGLSEPVITDIISVINGEKTFNECKAIEWIDPFKMAMTEIVKAGYTEPEAAGLLGGNSKPIMKADLFAMGYDNELVDKVISGDKVAVFDSLLQEVVTDADRRAEMLSCMATGDIYTVPDTTVDTQAVVQEALQKIGMDEDLIGRVKLAMNADSQLDIAPTSYVDVFDKCGALMLRRVREIINKDSSLESRSSVTDVMTAYFRVLMGREEKIPDILDSLQSYKDKAKPKGAEIIAEAMQILREG